MEFLRTNLANGILPHANNILQVHKRISKHVQKLDQLSPIYCGGYPTALLLAPRHAGAPYVIQSEYFSDIDVYARDTQHLKELLTFADTMPEQTTKPIVTNNAKTYQFKNVQIQIIKKVCGQPASILSTFDFKNCAIAFVPGDQDFYLHQEVMDLHVQRKLDHLAPWMLENITPTTEHYVIVQLLRFKKYCERWDYTLSKRTLDFLLAIYNRLPTLSIKKGSIYQVGSGRIPGVGKNKQNIWHAVASVFLEHPSWQDSLDKHGHIINQLSQPTTQPASSIADIFQVQSW